MLEYDNSAFYYFSLTLISIYLLPGYYYLFKELYVALLSTPSAKDGTKARTSLEQEKAEKIRSKSHGVVRLQRPAFITNLVCLVIATLVFLYLVSLVIRDGEVSTFDPYTILGIESGAAVAEIKRAYRKLSLKYHPDKNIGSKAAEEMFMKVAKAYEALTDETSKENYEKFGNPDGKQSLEVSIGLPSFILENPKVVLVLYLLAMVVVIPVAVGLWYSNSKQFGEKNILYESYTAFYQLMSENHRVKHMPEVMAASAECRRINHPVQEEESQLTALKSRMKGDKVMFKPKFEAPMVLKGNLLIHAHVLRITAELSPKFRSDLEQMLVKAPELIEGMIEIAHQRRWLQTTLATIRFQQLVVQALWTGDSSLLQLPHFTESDVKAVSGGARLLREYLRTADDAKKGLAKMTAEQRADVMATCALLPQIDITTELYVEEEEAEDGEEETRQAADDEGAAAVKGNEIYENDLVTLRVVMTRTNVSEGCDASPVLAPLFPAALRENWWVILTDRADGADAEANMHAIEKISDQSRVVKHELRFMAPNRAGTYAMTLRLLSDCYVGLDEEIEIVFTVHPQAELPAYAPHPEDVELDNEPTLFEQVMTADLDESSDEEGDDEDEDAGGGGASDLKRSAVRNLTSPVVLDEDSEEED